MVVQKMEKAAKEQGIAVEIKCCGIEEFTDLIADYDCSLLGPQLNISWRILSLSPNNTVNPSQVINSMDYGMMKVKRY